MKKQETPKPGSKDYDPGKTEKLTTPKYHSSTDHRASHELPATENLNDQQQGEPEEKIKEQDAPKTELGNKRHPNEKQREKIITP